VLGDAPRFSWFSKADNRTRTQEQDVFTQPVNMAGMLLSVFVLITSHSLMVQVVQAVGCVFVFVRATTFGPNDL